MRYVGILVFQYYPSKKYTQNSQREKSFLINPFE